MRPPKCAAHTNPATATLRRAAELASIQDFVQRRKRLFSSRMACGAGLGVDAATVERWEIGETRIPAWALIALERLTHGGSHAVAPAPLVAGTQRAKHLNVRLNENGAPAVNSAEAQPGNTTGGRSSGLGVDSEDATGSNPGDRAPIHPNRDATAQAGTTEATSRAHAEAMSVASEGSGPAEPRAGQLVDSPRESAAYSSDTEAA